MCLSVAVARPSDVLGKGNHAGFEWQIVHNGLGNRCGYVKLEPGHPWFGKGYDEIDAKCHGGLTFAEADTECGAGGPDNGWWIGFDAGHAFDLPDPSLPRRHRPPGFELIADFGNLFEGLAGVVPPHGRDVPAVCSQAYMEGQCRSLCEQARNAIQRQAAPPASGGL
jgi:hypothetical protein